MSLQQAPEQEQINVLSQSDEILPLSQPQKPFSYWLKKNWYYHKQVRAYYQFAVAPQSSVLHLNCKNGYLLNAVNPLRAVGIDTDADAIAAAKADYPGMLFLHGVLHDHQLNQTFDYIVLSLSVMETYDIQELLESLHLYCHSGTRIIVESYNFLWQPILQLTQKLRLRRQTQFKNWVSHNDLVNFLQLADYQLITRESYTLVPFYIPLFSTLCNKFLIHLPLVKKLCLNQQLVARAVRSLIKEPMSVSVIVPCRNEKGNIEPAVVRCPQLAPMTEIIFVEGNSQDGTLAEIQRVASAYPQKNISWYVQSGKGKGDAVRKGFAHATGDVLIILDGDITVMPEELPKFVNALAQGKGELINGSRLVYGMENQAMRFLNICANFFFSVLFSWLLNQRIKDTLCGTKALWAADYKKIAANRYFFGNFDPFGDFDLLFGAAKLNLKIVDVPIHYKNRIYGTTQIRRFLHGWILLGMSLVALKKIKLR